MCNLEPLQDPLAWSSSHGCDLTNHLQIRNIVLSAYGESAAASRAAQMWVVAMAQRILEQAFFNVQMSVPNPDGTQCSYMASLLSNRLKIQRAGTMHNGGKWQIDDLLNVRARVASNFPAAVIRDILLYMGTHSSIISIERVDAGACMPTAGAEQSQSQTPDHSAVGQRSVKKTLTKKAQKKPSRKA